MAGLLSSSRFSRDVGDQSIMAGCYLVGLVEAWVKYQIRTVEFCADRLLNEPIGFVVHARRRFVQDQDRLQKTLDPSSLKSFSYVCPEPVLTNDSVQNNQKTGPKGVVFAPVAGAAPARGTLAAAARRRDSPRLPRLGALAHRPRHAPSSQAGPFREPSRPAERRPLFLVHCSYVCPEPVLAKIRCLG